MGYSKKVRRKWGIVFKFTKMIFLHAPWKYAPWEYFFFFNSKQNKEAGRAFKSKYDHLI